MAFTFVNVTASYETLSGAPASGQITVTPTAPMSNAGMTVSTIPVPLILTNGQATFQVAAVDDTATTPTGVAYTILEQITGATPRSYQVQFSASNPTVNLSDLAQAVNASPTVTYQLVSAKNQAGGYAGLDSNGLILPGVIPMASLEATLDGRYQGKAAFGSASDIQFIAQLAAAGSTGRFADAGHVHPSDGDSPALWGLHGWTDSPKRAGATWVPTGAAASGIIYLTKIHIGTAFTWSNIVWGLAGTAAGAATTGNYFGVYDSSGSLKGVTADLTSVHNGATGAKTSALTSAFSATTGYYFIACLVNGTWASNTWSLKAQGGGVTANLNTAAPNYWYSNMLTGQTSLPSTLNLANQLTTAVVAGACSQFYGVS